MATSILYGMASGVGALIVLTIALLNREAVTRKDKTFFTLICTIIAFLAVDAIWGLFASQIVVIQGSAGFSVASTCYHLMTVLVTLAWSWYILTHLKEEKYVKLTIIPILLSVFQIILLIMNIFNGCIFSIGDQLEYITGPMRLTEYIIQFGTFIGLALICLFVSFKNKSMRYFFRRLIFVLLIVAVIGNILQNMLPDAPCYSISFIISIMLLITYHLNEMIEEKNLQLQTALKLSNAANIAKTTFLFNMSHDIRTPMNAILGFTEMAKKHSEEKDVVDNCLNKIQISATHLLKLINDVLDFSRIEAGKTNIKLGPTSMKKGVGKILLLMEEKAESKNIELIPDTSGIVHDFVKADDLHVTQVILNIIGNSIKYTNEGGKIYLSVSESESTEPNHAKYAIVIEDTGVGMSKEFLATIFDEFSREESATINKIEGTGLGMSIVKRLVDAMNGEIEVSSELGKGTKTTLTFVFELISEDEFIASDTEEKEETDTIQTTVLSSKRALVVDDNDLNREILIDILNDENVITEEAADGKEAVDKIISAGPTYYDFILMDVQMPVMNGLDATRNIRNTPGFEKLVIIALSANAFDEDVQISLNAGMNAHLAKPIDVRNLTETLYRLMRK